MSDEPEFPFNPEDFFAEQGYQELARMGLTIYRTLKRDGAADDEAFAVTAAYFAGLNKAHYKDTEDDGD